MNVARAGRWRSDLPFLLVIAAMLAAILFLAVAPEQWHSAMMIMAVALLAAGAARLALPDSLAGSLAIRSRWWDGFCYLAIGGVILAVTIRLH